MKNRSEIFAEAKRQGLTLTGMYFVDRQHSMLINSAYVVSRSRRLMESMTLEDAIAQLIVEERGRINNNPGNFVS